MKMKRSRKEPSIPIENCFHPLRVKINQVFEDMERCFIITLIRIHCRARSQNSIKNIHKKKENKKKKIEIPHAVKQTYNIHSILKDGSFSGPKKSTHIQKVVHRTPVITAGIKWPLNHFEFIFFSIHFVSCVFTR